MSTTEQPLSELIDEGWACLTDLEDCLGGLDRLEALDEQTRKRVVGDLETLTAIADALESLVETIEFEELAAAIDTDEAIDALEPGELPAVLADEADTRDLVDVNQLAEAMELLAAWNATELRGLWEEADELTDAVDDLGGEDAGMIGAAVEDVLDRGEDGILETLETEDVKAALGTPDPGEDPTAYQVFIQQQAMVGIDAFRKALLLTHETFEQLYAFNRERMGAQQTRPHSRNPTAVSTCSGERIGVGSGHNHATVPRSVRFSTAPTRRRIYGHRFARERERLREDDS